MLWDLWLKSPTTPEVDADDPITADYLYASYAKFFKPDDIIIVDSGTSFYGLLPIFLPKGARFHSQTLWGAIGWATPASFGASLAAPDRRVILITGEGVAPDDRSGDQPVLPLWSKAYYFRAE